MLFKIYGKPDCGYCKKAVKILEENNISYQYYTVGEDISKEELEDSLGRTITTVPQIINQGGYIGGYTDLCDYLIENNIV